MNRKFASPKKIIVVIYYVNCGPCIFQTYVNCVPGIFEMFVDCGLGYSDSRSTMQFKNKC